MEVISIGSSSSGNSYIIKAGSENLLLDVGLSATKIVNALNSVGLNACDISAVLITHEHIDHVKSVRAVSRKCPDARFIVSRGTRECCNSFDAIADDRISYISGGESMTLGDVVIRCFELSHDAAEPVGYSICADGRQLTVVTDTGIISEDIFNEMLTADILVFEANHDENLLMIGEYPYPVKMRIKSDVGHLSNVKAAEVLTRLMNERQSEEELSIMLAHLSEKNNLPFEARACIEERLKADGYERNQHYCISIAAKEGLTYI